jgi:glycosyltransferase involved in cell wall biosynthesis
MNEGFRPCVLIPTFDNPLTIAGVVAEARNHISDILIVDDGSGDEGRRAVDAIEREGYARVARRATNGGKGAAVKTGFAAARDLGYTHALQLDADGQHDLRDIPRFLALASDNPRAAVLGHPVYDETMPRGKKAAHGLTNFWTRVETGGRHIVDPQCGYRVYPLASALDAGAGADRMAFDIEIAVRLVWAGVPIINVPTRVRYLPREAGGVSHFRLVRDNLAITLMHIRLTTTSIFRRIFSLLGLGRRAR